MTTHGSATEPESYRWEYHPAEDLDQSLTERLRHFPRQPDMLVYGARAGVALAVRTWLRLYHRLEIIGRENLPLRASFVMVANHSSHLDAVTLQAALPLSKLHRTYSAAASDYFFESLPLTWIATVFANALPFSRELKIRQSLGLCHALLQNPGNVLILFPEGTRTPDGKVGRFRPGVGMLLAGKPIPVVPCFLSGAFSAWPKGRAVPLPAKLSLRIGTPRSYAHVPPGKAGALGIAEELERAVVALGESGGGASSLPRVSPLA